MKTRTISAVIAILLLAILAGCSIPAGVVTTPPASDTPNGSETAAATPSTVVISTPTVIPTTAPGETPVTTPAATLAPTPSPLPDPLIVTERTLIYSNEYIDVDIRYPEISGMEDAAQQSGINEGVSVYLKDMATELETRSEETAASGEHGVYTIESSYAVKRNDGGILSVRISISSYGGGANTSSDSAFINVINSDPAQQPKLAELFAPGADYMTVLNNRISALIAADPYADMFSFTSVSSSEWYYLTDTALVIVFPRYAITSGVYGEPEFSVPLADLAGMLNPGIA